MNRLRAGLFGFLGGVVAAGLMGVVLSQTVVTIHPGTVRIGGETAPAAGVEVDVRDSVDGASLDIHIANTSDTANSDAIMRSSVAGTSAGDAKFQSRITGGSPEAYAWGQDNSDGDAWKLSRAFNLGNNDVIVARIGDELTFPGQPAFSVLRNTDQSISTGASFTNVAWNSETFDVGANFDTGSSDYFITPVSGKYFFTCKVEWAGNSTGIRETRLSVRVQPGSFVELERMTHDGTSGQLDQRVEALLDLQGDAEGVPSEVACEVSQNSGSSINVQGSFYGWKVS